MSETLKEIARDSVVAERQSVPVDVWAVLLAFVLAVLVRVGVLQNVPW